MAIVATHVAAVQELYVAYFGRPADPAGLDYWTNVVEAQGGSTTAVSASFATQPEYVVAFYQKTPAQIVDQIYANMFARGASTTDGRSYWVDLLAKGTVGVSTIVAEVMKGAIGTDATAVENKIEAATAFTAALDLESEQAGYAGNDALALAKAWITGITTDATLTAAIAPTALDAQVAAIVKAGTPFSLESGVAELRAANKAIADFRKANDLEDGDLAVGETPQGELDKAVTAAETEIQTKGLVANFVGATAGVQAAQLAAVEAKNDATLAKEQKDLAAARAAAAADVRAVADNLAAATAADKEAKAEAAEALLIQNAARDTVAARAEGRAVTVNVDADGKFVSAGIAAGTDAVADPADTLVVVSNGSIVLDSGITEANFPGVTALRDAIRANEDAKLVAKDAAAVLVAATGEYTTGLDATEKAQADLIRTETAAVAGAEKAITDLAKLVAKWEESVDLATEYTSLTDAQKAAIADFTGAGYLEPQPFNGPTALATAGSDIFILGTSDAVTLSSFGRSGDDSIFLGSDFKLNTGDVEDGDNAVLEVFFVQNGSRAEIHVEKAVYGSESEDMAVITLIGVNADDLQFSNGVITLSTNA